MSSKNAHLNDTVDRFVGYILDKMGDPHVVIGPWCWKPSDGADSKLWYFMVSTCDKKGEWRTDQVCSHDREDRALFTLALLYVSRERQKPLIMHDFDDELRAIKWCEMLWPGKRISRVRQAVEAERANEARAT